MIDANAFWARVQKTEGCWLWMGSRNRSGHGRTPRFGSLRRPLAHRVAWIISNGPIPATAGYHGTCVCHTCDNPPCVNPAHLFLGTAADNARDRDDKGRDAPSRKTHCPLGHAYDERNTYRAPRGGRGCRQCRNAASRKSQEKRRVAN